MQIERTPIADVFCYKPDAVTDSRGFFMETYRESWLRSAGIEVSFVQENHCQSQRGTLRGLHYQIRQPQGKLVRVIRGEVFDVAVDMRRSSPTFGQWVAATLSAANRCVMWIPPGFAHGFYVISSEAEFLYKCTDYYAPEHERTLCWNDPEIAIRWPIAEGETPLLSDKDKQGQRFRAADTFD